MPKYSKLLILFALMLILSISACGDEADDDDNNNQGTQVQGTVLLADSDKTYLAPHVFDLDGITTIMYRNLAGKIFAEKLSTKEFIAIDMKTLSGASYGVTQYSINQNYLVWNVSTAQSFRSRWSPNTTDVAQTGVLAPGSCIIKQGDNDVYVAAQVGGYLIQVTMSKFSDASKIVRNTLLDPALGSDPVTVKSFACDSRWAFVATTDGRLFKTDLTRSLPKLEELGQDSNFNLLQYSSPYLVWLDTDDKIKMYNVEKAEGPTLAINSDDKDLTIEPINDMRIFGSVVLWSEKGPENYDIYGADLSKAQSANDIVQLSNDAGDQKFPFLYKGELYWEDNRNGSYEIWKGAMSEI